MNKSRVTIGTKKSGDVKPVNAGPYTVRLHALGGGAERDIAVCDSYIAYPANRHKIVHMPQHVHEKMAILDLAIASTNKPFAFVPSVGEVQDYSIPTDSVYDRYYSIVFTPDDEQIEAPTAKSIRRLYV